MPQYIAKSTMVVIGKTTTNQTLCLEIKKDDKISGNDERLTIFRNGNKLGNFDPIYLQKDKIRKI